MKNYNYLLKLSKTYVKNNKKSVFPMLLIIFLSIFMLSSTVIIKDSYDKYDLKLSERTFGNWDVHYTMQETDMDVDYTSYLDVKNYKEYLQLSYQDNDLDHIFYAVSKFDDTFPITIDKGRYPTNNREIIIDESFAKQNNYNINDSITFFDGSNQKVNYKISGIFSNNFWSPTTLFWTFSDQSENDNFRETYAEFKPNISIQTFLEQKPDIMEVNEGLIYQKYHLNNTFDILFYAFTLMIGLCCFLFIYNVSSMYLKKRKHELKQLSYAGATIKQIRMLIFNEIILMNGLFGLLSLGFSIGFWLILINAFGEKLSKLLKLSINLSFCADAKHLGVIIAAVITMLVITFIIQIIKHQKPKSQKLYFRKLHINKGSMSFRMAIRDVLRTGYGISICFILILVTLFCMSTNSVVGAWKEASLSSIDYTADVSVNFDLFQKSGNEIHNLIQDLSKLCKGEEGTYQFYYGVKADAKAGNEQIDKVYTIDDVSYDNLLKRHQINDKESILIVNASNTNTEVSIHVNNKWGETLAYLQYPCKTIQDDTLSFDTPVVIVPAKLTEQWQDAYPETYVAGNLKLNGPKASQKGMALQNNWKLSMDDHLYIMDNYEKLQQYNRDIAAINIFIYGFYIIAILVSICIIYNISLQYFISKTRDIYLSYTSGMTRKDIAKQYNIQILFVMIISLCVSFIILLGLNSLIKVILNMHISYISFMIQFILYSVILFVLLKIMMKNIIKQNLTDMIEQN